MSLLSTILKEAAPLIEKKVLSKAVLKAAVSQLAGLGRKVVPLSEKAVMKRVTTNADDIAKSIIDFEGVSFSPRLNRILTPDDYGHMMSVVKEQDWSRLPVNKEDAADVAKRVIEIAKQPGMMQRLRRGENYGGWINNGELVMDPSVRHLSKDVSILRGMNANQDAGFSLRGSDGYDLKQGTGIFTDVPNDPHAALVEIKMLDEVLRQEAMRRLLAKSAVGASTVGGLGTGGYLASND
jgi:hypothetical protein